MLEKNICVEEKSEVSRSCKKFMFCCEFVARFCKFVTNCRMFSMKVMLHGGGFLSCKSLFYNEWSLCLNLNDGEFI